mgnify:CR=1 FL=1
MCREAEPASRAQNETAGYQGLTVGRDLSDIDFGSDEMPGSELHEVLHAYRAASSVIMAYKAIEMEATALQREALAHVTAHLARIDECATTGHPRTDREHLLVSLLCAQWHLELSLGETEAFLATLDRCRAVAAELENHFTPAFNLSLALLIRCVLLSRAGDASGAGEIAAEGMQLFKRAVADATDKLTLFQELRMSHRNVHVMLQAASPSKRIKPDYDAWVLFSLRVRGAPAERLKDAALAIADAGADVVLIGRDSASLEKTANDIRHSLHPLG